MNKLSIIGINQKGQRVCLFRGEYTDELTSLISEMKILELGDIIKTYKILEITDNAGKRIQDTSKIKARTVIKEKKKKKSQDILEPESQAEKSAKSWYSS